MKKHKTLSIRQRTIDRLLPTAIVLTSLAFIVVAWSTISKPASAITPPDSCFAFSAGKITNYYNNENNDSEQPACTRSVDIPAQIGGVPVTTIGENSFNGNGVTALSLPSSVSVIESSAFTGLSLTNLQISSGGDLLIDNGAFSSVSLTMPSLTIEAAGNLTTLYSFSGGISMSGTLTLHAGNTLQTSNGFFAGNTLGAVQLTTDSGNIEFSNGSFSGTNVGQVSMNAGADINIAHGSFNSTTGVDLHAGGDITIESGAFSVPTVGGSLVVDAGGMVLIDGAMSSGSFTSVAITAVNDITLGDTVFGSQNGLATATLDSTSGAVRINSAFYGGTGSYLTDLTIRAADGLYIDRGFLSDNSNLEVHFDVNGDVVIENGSFTNAQLNSFDIDTNGSITIDDSAFAGIGYIRYINWRAGGNITLSSPPSGSGLSSWWGNQYYAGFTTTINLQAGDDLHVGDDIFAEAWNLETLTLEAGGNAYFGEKVFSYTQLASSFTLPAGTTYIGDEAFSFNNIESVYLQGATPTIGDYAFSFSGVTTIWPPDSSLEHEPVGDFENVRYIQLYTDNLGVNPGNYPDTAYAAKPVGLSGDWMLDRPAGGYIINPATYTVNYQSASGDTIAPSLASGAGPMLTHYLVSANPTGDFSQYYRSGGVVSLAAPSVTGYITPVGHDLTLVSSVNEYTFIYNTEDEENNSSDGSDNSGSLEGAPNTGLGYAVDNNIMAMITIALIGSLIIVGKYNRVRTNS